MEKMVRRICLDTDILIGLLRKDASVKAKIEVLNGEFCSTSVNSFEVWHGRKSVENISDLFSWLHILPFDDKAGRVAGDLMRELKKRGTVLEIRDVFIAATCVRYNVELLTANKKHFQRLTPFGLLLIE